ncbi:MAG: F0F1 ATP synthase subunit B [bacterium]
MEQLAWHVLLVQLATFVIGALLLWRIAYLPIREILAQRRERIAAEAGAARASREAADAVQAELRGRLAAVEEDQRKRAAAAEAEARKLRDEVLAVARTEASAVLAAARAQGRRERAEMQEQLRKEVARLAVAMARKVTASTLTAKDRKRLVDRVLKELPKQIEGKA